MMRLYRRGMLKYNADEVANHEDLEEQSDLTVIWVCTLCQNISINNTKLFLDVSA